MMFMNATHKNTEKTWVKIMFVVMRPELYPFPSLFYWLKFFVPVDHVGQVKAECSKSSA